MSGNEERRYEPAGSEGGCQRCLDELSFHKHPAPPPEQRSRKYPKSLSPKPRVFRSDKKPANQEDKDKPDRNPDWE